ncbi:MAG: hypothetical protein ACFCUJ_02305 [Thiotrichales bacterium]
MPLVFAHLNLHLRLQLHPETLRARLAASPAAIGRQLAEQISAYERQHLLGYYPALDYFRQLEDCGVERELIDAAESVAWVTAQLTRQETVQKLRPVFSSIEVRSVQNEAFSMPSVRPRQKDALDALVQHYTPDKIKLGLKVSLLQKRAQSEGLESFTRKMAHKWLRDSFATLEVLHVNLIAPPPP